MLIGMLPYRTTRATWQGSLSQICFLVAHWKRTSELNDQNESGHSLVNHGCFLASLLCTFNLPTTDDAKLDVISSLPTEILTSIFRMLDPTSMLAAMRIRRSWFWLQIRTQTQKNPEEKGSRTKRKKKTLLIHNLPVERNSSWYRQPQADHSDIW